MSATAKTSNGRFRPALFLALVELASMVKFRWAGMPPKEFSAWSSFYTIPTGIYLTYNFLVRGDKVGVLKNAELQLIWKLE